MNSEWSAQLSLIRFIVILRSVAGLLHHLQALKPDLPDFDENFLQCLRIYRAARTKSQFLENSVSAPRWFKFAYIKRILTHAMVQVFRHL